jgi:hypothetical protein
MHLRVMLFGALLLPSLLFGQSAASAAPREDVMFAYENYAAVFGSRLAAALDSIPAARYDYRPTPSQQSIGYIAQHLEDANYGLCSRIGHLEHATTAKDSLRDTIKARWPKDTLVARYKASLQFCYDALGRVPRVNTVGLASDLLNFETDLAEHYSQLSVYMRLLGMVPPSALRPAPRAAIDLPPSVLSRYVGLYQIVPGAEFDVTSRADALFMRSSLSGYERRLWPESSTEFFVKEVDAQITFVRDARGTTTGLIVHQFGRDRPARKLR